MEELADAVAASREPGRLSPEDERRWYAFGYMLTLLPAALEAQMQQAASISHFEFQVMASLSMAKERTRRMSEVAQYTGSTLSRLSNAVSRLEKRGWVSRRPDPADGRCTLATLTAKGKAKVDAAAPAYVDEVHRLVFDTLTAAQQRQLETISHRILRTLQAPCPVDEARHD
ncbi:MarR family winged helix-turn-helix transcriptional regulator [Lentzea sp. JNUCC 0626]|uniref:MarR family winged helix-turn-helix transcriptional regulator n=1 Tax=Lentzea sp. JNUCC 0626 TaxID=3367513 RepID=UPI0037485FC5